MEIYNALDRKELIKEINSFVPLHKKLYKAVDFLLKHERITKREYNELTYGCFCSTEGKIVWKLLEFRKILQQNND